MHARLAVSLVLLAWVATASPAAGPEKIEFKSAGSLQRSADGLRFTHGPPIALSGELDLPAGAGPFPVVVLAHGCDGIGPTESGWASVLRSWGYATFLLDSFGGRGLEEVCTDARVLTGPQRIADAYGALRALSKHPKIDARRAALMGFSHGGILTLGASTVWARQTYAPAGKPAFRAFFPFYPYCNVEYPEREHISAPVRIHVGALDDWTPAAPCERMVKAWKASGQNAAITIYPGAHHSFDYPDLSEMRLPNVDNGATCAFKMPSILGPTPPPEAAARCVKKGATIGGSREATEKAEKELRKQFAELLK